MISNIEADLCSLIQPYSHAKVASLPYRRTSGHHIRSIPYAWKRMIEPLLGRKLHPISAIRWCFILFTLFPGSRSRWGKSSVAI
jgi:hypothetical protein